MDFSSGKFSLYFMGYKKPDEIPASEEERRHFALSTLATIELTQWVLFARISLLGVLPN